MSARDFADARILEFHCSGLIELKLELSDEKNGRLHFFYQTALAKLLHSSNFGDNIAVVHKCFLPALSVIAFSDLKVLTKRSVGRISRRDLARDVCEMFHFVQHDKLCFGQQLYYCHKLFMIIRGAICGHLR